MTEKELKNITSVFSDLKPLIALRSELLNKTSKIRRRLKTKLSKYVFLSDIVGIGIKEDHLVNAVVSFFKELGFVKVENIEKKKKEDIRLFTEDILLLIEVTGTSSSTLKDNKIHQISKHIPLNQEKFKELQVFGLFVVNHDNEKHYLEREKNPFNNEMHNISKSHNYSITTTIHLLNAFTEFKCGNMTAKEIVEKLCSSGEVKINRTGKSPE